MSHYHDHGYKQLYSFPKMVEDLLTGFIHQDWVSQLDFSSLEKLNSSYITDDLRSRSDDIIWRVKLKDQWLYVYLLLEFQSTIDPHMAVRILSYVGLLYQDLIKSGQLPADKTLPPVLPIVLYNGNKPWNAAQSISELLPDIPESLQAFQPQQRYWLIDEGRYSAQELEKLENLTAAIIRAELAEDQVQFAKVAANLNIWLSRPEQDNLRRALKEWLLSLIRHRIPDIQVNELQNLTEIESMLARNWSEKWIAKGMAEGIAEGKAKGIAEGKAKGIAEGKAKGIAEGKAKGIAEGMAEGIAEGKAKGEAALLERLLAKRFGLLPPWTKEKLANANTQQLEHWGDNILDAKTLEAVFDQ